MKYVKIKWCAFAHKKSYAHFSLFDLVSDIALADEYLRGNPVNKTVTDVNDPSVANVTERTCTLVFSSSSGYTFSCMEYNYWYGHRRHIAQWSNAFTKRVQ